MQLLICTYPYVSRIFLISYFFVNKHVNFSLPQNALKNMNFADKKFQFLNKLQYCFVNEHVNFSSPQNTLRNMSFANQKVPVFFGSTFFEAILSSLYTPPPPPSRLIEHKSYVGHLGPYLYKATTLFFLQSLYI